MMQFDSLNNSWLNGFIKTRFPHHLFVDFLNVNCVPESFSISHPLIIYLDDENDTLCNQISQKFSKSDIIICKIKNVFDKLSNQGYNCVYFPYWHIVDDIIALNKLENKISTHKNNNKTYTFSCLNRRYTGERVFTVQTLRDYNLLEYGYVTLNGLILPLESNSNLTHYIDSKFGGFERHNHWIDGIGYSSNVANYFYIQQNIKSSINISVETTMDPFFPTEKSFLGLFTKQIPIILAEPNRINELRQEGFDMYDDYINHSYDNVNSSWQERIIQAIQLNQDALRNFDIDINLRATNNLEYLKNEWTNRKLQLLVESIEIFI
jgi:hypothetical protein